MTNKVLARGKESSSRDRHGKEIDWTKVIEQSWGTRLANTSTKSYSAKKRLLLLVSYVLKDCKQNTDYLRCVQTLMDLSQFN